MKIGIIIGIIVVLLVGGFFWHPLWAIAFLANGLLVIYVITWLKKHPNEAIKMGVILGNIPRANNE